MILLEDNMDYADRVLKETLKHSSTSPEAISITQEIKENHELFDSLICFPLTCHKVDILQYYSYWGWGEMKEESPNIKRN